MCVKALFCRLTLSEPDSYVLPEILENCIVTTIKGPSLFHEHGLDLRALLEATGI